MSVFTAAYSLSGTSDSDRLKRGIDLQSLFARKIICLPLEIKKFQGSSIAIDIIITFYASLTDYCRVSYSREETLMI